VRDIGLNATANALIQSLVSLGDAMNLSVIAEGIENEEQLKLLRLLHCEYLQGFHISRPVAAEEIGKLLAALGESTCVPVAPARTGRDQLSIIAANA
jgi:EAL domain-containing protein (putative c-di-GMP-specific phosphodiesterase class I)